MSNLKNAIVKVGKRKAVFIKNTAILTLTSFFNRTLGLMFRSYLSYKIGPMGIGMYGLIIEIYSFAVTITSSGLSLAVTRLVSENITSNSGNIKKIVSTCMCISLIVSVFIGLIMFFFAPHIALLILRNSGTILSIRILAFSLPFLAISACLRGYFYGARKAIYSASEQIIEQVIEMIVFAILIRSFFYKGIDLACATIVIGTTVAEFVSCIYSFIFYAIDVKKYKTKSSRNFLRESLCIAVPVTASSCISSGLSTIENVLVPWAFEKYGFSKNSSLSNYGIITGMVSPLISFPSAVLLSIAVLLIPEVSESNILGRKKDVKRISFKVIRLTFLFSLFTMIIFILFGDNISILIYKNNSCGMYLKFFAPIIPLVYLGTVIDGILKGLNDQIKMLSYSFTSSVVGIILTFLLIPVWGINGAIVVIFVNAILRTYLSASRLYKLLIFSNISTSRKTTQCL